MAFWDFLRSKNKKALSGGVGGSALVSQYMQGNRPPPRGSDDILTGYKSLPRLRGVVDRIAKSVGTTKWRVYRIPRAQRLERMADIRSKAPTERTRFIKGLADGSELEQIHSHPMLDVLNAPNPRLTYRQIRETAQIHLDLVGETFMVVERDDRGIPQELWPIPPNWVTKLPENGDLNYEYRKNGVIERVSSENMIWMKEVDPADPYGRGCGVGLTLNNELDADEYAARTVAYRFFNQATPEMIISMLGLSRDSIKAAKDSWLSQNQGYHNTAIPHFTNADVKVEKLDPSFVELDLVALRKSLADAIREAYSTPPEIMGDIKNSNRSTIDAAAFLFSMFSLVPRLDLWEDHLNLRLAPMFGPDICTLYESPVPEDRAFIQAMMGTHSYAFTVDEIRKAVGYAPSESGIGDKHPLQPGVLLVDPAEASAVSAEPYTNEEDPEEG